MENRYIESGQTVGEDIKSDLKERLRSLPDAARSEEKEHQNTSTARCGTNQDSTPTLFLFPFTSRVMFVEINRHNQFNSIGRPERIRYKII